MCWHSLPLYAKTVSQRGGVTAIWGVIATESLGFIRCNDRDNDCIMLCCCFSLFLIRRRWQCDAAKAGLWPDYLAQSHELGMMPCWALWGRKRGTEIRVKFEKEDCCLRRIWRDVGRLVLLCLRTGGRLGCGGRGSTTKGKGDIRI